MFRELSCVFGVRKFLLMSSFGFFFLSLGLGLSALLPESFELLLPASLVLESFPFLLFGERLKSGVLLGLAASL